MRGCVRLWLLYIALVLLRGVAGSEGDPELAWISSSIASRRPGSADASGAQSSLASGSDGAVGSTDSPVYALSEDGQSAPGRASFSVGPDPSSGDLLGGSAGVRYNLAGALQGSNDSQSQGSALSSSSVERPGFVLSSPQFAGTVFMPNTRVSSGGLLPVAGAPTVQRTLGLSVQVAPDQTLQDGASAQSSTRSSVSNLVGANFQSRPASSPVAQAPSLSGSVSTPQSDFGTQYSKVSSPPVWRQTSLAAFPALLSSTSGLNSPVNVASDTKPSQGTSAWQQASPYQSSPFQSGLSQDVTLSQYRKPDWYGTAGVSQDFSSTRGVQIPGTQLQGVSQSVSSAPYGSSSGSLSPYGSIQSSWGISKPGVTSDVVQVQKPSGTPTCPFTASVPSGISSGVALTGSGTLPGLSGRYAGSQVASSDTTSTSRRVFQSPSSASFGSSQGFPNNYGVQYTLSKNAQQVPVSGVIFGQQPIGFYTLSGSSTGTSQSSIGYGSPQGLSSIYGGVQDLLNKNVKLGSTYDLTKGQTSSSQMTSSDTLSTSSSVPQSPSSTGQMSSLGSRSTQTTNLGSTGLLVGLQTSGFGSQVASSDTTSTSGRVFQSPSSTGQQSPQGPLFPLSSIQMQGGINVLQPSEVKTSSVSSSSASDASKSSASFGSSQGFPSNYGVQYTLSKNTQQVPVSGVVFGQQPLGFYTLGGSSTGTSPSSIGYGATYDSTRGQTSGSQMTSSDTISTSSGVPQSPSSASSTGSMVPYGPLFTYGSMPRQGTQTMGSFSFLQPSEVKTSSVSSSSASDASKSSASFGSSQGFPNNYGVQYTLSQNTQQVPFSGVIFGQQPIGSKTTLSGSSTGSSQALSSSYGGVQGTLNRYAQQGSTSGLTAGQTSSSQMTSSDATSSQSVSQSPSSTGQLSPQGPLFPYSSILRQGSQTPGSFNLLQPSGVKTGVSPSYFLSPDTQQKPASGLTVGLQSTGSMDTLSGSSTGISQSSTGYGLAQGLWSPYDLQRRGTQNFNLIPSSSMSGSSSGLSSSSSSGSSQGQSSNVYGDFQGLSSIYGPVQGQGMQSQRDFTQLAAASGLTVNQPTWDASASSTSGLSTSVSGGSQSSPGSSFTNRIVVPYTGYQPAVQGKPGSLIKL